MSNMTKLTVSAIVVFTIVSGIITLMMWGIPQYRVYSQTMRGTAAFKEAEIDRQILVEEARAQEEALTMKANGEASREKIKSLASKEAIQNIGSALETNPSYLRWMWINEIAGGKGDRIYIPTEAGMPILEAGASITK